MNTVFKALSGANLCPVVTGMLKGILHYYSFNAKYTELRTSIYIRSAAPSIEIEVWPMN